MYRMNDKECALMKVRQLGFMCDDLRLFMDTHPCDEEAFCALKYFIAAEKEARAEYEKCYGPLRNEGVEKHESYTWICGAWPWEMEA